jgi:hypothetical protein
MEDSKSMATPMSTTTTLDADEEGEHMTRRSTGAWLSHSSTWLQRGQTSSSRYVCALVFKLLQGLCIGKLKDRLGNKRGGSEFVGAEYGPDTNQ